MTIKISLQNFALKPFLGGQKNPEAFLFLGYPSGKIVFEDAHGPGLDATIDIKDMEAKVFFNEVDGEVVNSLRIGMPGKNVPATATKDGYRVSTIGLDQVTYDALQVLAADKDEIKSAFRAVQAKVAADAAKAVDEAGAAGIATVA